MRLLKEISDLQYLDINAKLDKTTDPLAFLNQLFIEAKEVIALATIDLADAIFLEKKLNQIIHHLDLQAQKQPTLSSLKPLLEHYQKLLTDAVEVSSLLKVRLDNLKLKFEEVKRKIYLLYAGHSYTENKVYASYATQYDVGKVFLRFGWFEDRMLKVETEGVTESDDGVFDEFKIYEMQEKIEEELKNMKTKMGI